MEDLLKKARLAGVEIEIKADDDTVAIKVARGAAYGYVTLRTVGELRAWLAGMEWGARNGKRPPKGAADGADPC